MGRIIRIGPETGMRPARPQPAVALHRLVLAAAIALGPVVAPALSRAENEQTILAIVNDDPITAFDVNQRIALMVIGNDAVNKRVQDRMKAESSP